MPIPIVPIEIGDTVKLKKPHACGENSWVVTKLGMDIGLQCSACGRKVRLVRKEFDRRFRGFLARGADRAEADRVRGGADDPQGGSG